MKSPEMGPQEPEEEIYQEKEQTPEEILETIKEAIEQGHEILLTQKKSDGSIIANQALPIAIDGKFLLVEADSYGFEIELDGIKEVESIEALQREMIDQIPALEEMFQERKNRLKTTTDAEELKTLNLEIDELEQEIKERKEFFEEE